MSLQLLQEPTPEQDRERLKECSNCDSCLDWHKICNAECCRIFSLNDRNYDLSLKKLLVLVTLTPDQQWYYRLHGCHYTRGRLIISTEYCKKVGGKIQVHRDCDLLTEDNKCSGHETHKPKICRLLTKETALGGELTGIMITPNCKFKYDIMEANNGKKEKTET